MRDNQKITKKMNSKSFTIILSLLLGSFFGVAAQEVSFEDYMRSVARNNIEAVAERYNIDIAEANLEASRVFNDPELSVSYGNNQDWDLMMGQNVDVEVGYNVSLGGLRKARMSVSEGERDLTMASLDAYMSGLRAEAAIAWSQAWRLREDCLLMKEELASMEQIAASDSIRLALGDVSSADAAQSGLEAKKLKGDLMALEAEYENALMALATMAGGMEITGLSEEKLPETVSGLQRSDVADRAEANRADLRAAEVSGRLSQKNLELIKASRAMELGLSLGYSFNTEVLNEIAPAPQFNGLVVGVSVPLKFSSMNKGEIKAARSTVSQQEAYVEAARRQVRMEAVQAWNTYSTAKEILSRYDGEMLGSAARILESRRQGYLKGENSLLEYLSARQTYNEVMHSYIEACCNCFESGIALQKAVGVSF